jgi:hypothetical protein
MSAIESDITFASIETMNDELRARVEPSWLVTNGSATVGPIDTMLLLQGITHGCIEEHCLVKQPAWLEFRPLRQIREVRAMYRLFDGEALSLEDAARFVPSIPLEAATNEDQVWKYGLNAAVEATRADFGLMHCPWEPGIGLVTTHAYGAHLKRSLGRVVHWYDEARWAAKGCPRIGDPKVHHFARATAARMTLRLEFIQNVLVASVTRPGVPDSVLELARTDRAFRERDCDEVNHVIELMQRRFEQLEF